MRLTGTTPDLKSLQELVKGFSVVVEKIKYLAKLEDPAIVEMTRFTEHK
jgi:hypothetical protein